jgi:oxygen-dependent protoporphyrinogen oxidase
MVTGVYAGDSRALSLRAAFPRMFDLERTYGGLVKALIALMKARKANAGSASGPSGKLTSFPEGLETLVQALVRRLDDRVITGRPVQALARRGDHWHVLFGDDDSLVCDAVVLSTPADAAAWLLAPHAPRAADVLRQIPYNPAAVVAFGYPPGSLPRPLDGFGYLVPAVEQRKILGSVWCSSLFPNRATRGRALMRSIIGGPRHPELVAEPDETLAPIVTAELSGIMGGAMPEPAFQRIIRWPQAIPQYTVGHLGRVAAIEAAVAAVPGLYLATNALYGVALADCIARAEKLPGIVMGGR